MRIITVSTGKAIDAEWAGNLKRTAIDKSPVMGRVAVTAAGLAGDERADVEHHGSPYQAVYAYARENYDWWEGELGRELRDGLFGENLTTAGLDVNGAKVGEVWRAGTVLLQVAGPRVPCVVFRNWLDEPAWVKRFTLAGRVGAYLRVLEPGTLAAGDGIEVVSSPADSITVTESLRAYNGDKPLLRRLLAHTGPGTKWDEVAERVLKHD
jgi:MOSC domain-containing protein YiiM